MDYHSLWEFACGLKVLCASTHNFGGWVSTAADWTPQGVHQPVRQKGFVQGSPCGFSLILVSAVCLLV